MIYSINPAHAHEMTIRLWDADISVEPGLRMEQRLAVNHALIVLLSGEADLELEDRVIRMSEGSVYICPGGKTFGIGGQGAEPVSVAIFHFSIYQAVSSRKEALHEIGEEAWMLRESRVGTMPSRKWHSICRKVYKHFHHNEPIRRWRAQLDFQEMLYEWAAANGKEANGDKMQALERAKAMIEERYNEELTIDRISEAAGFSANYFADLFKKTYGRSVMDYVAQVRMNKAKRLMLGSESLLKEVAHLVGYKDEFYFSRKFKKEYGLSPTAFIRKRKNKIALYGSTSLLGYLSPLQIIPYAAPLHPKWSPEPYHALGPDIPVHLSAFRQNHNRESNLGILEAAGPDRIVCMREIEDWEKERLARIAPVHELSLETENWREEFRSLAQWLDRTEEAEQWLGMFERHMAWLRSHVQRHAAQPAVAAVRVCRNRHVFYRSWAVNEVLYKQLGCRMPLVPEGISDQSVLTIEQLREMGAGHLLVLVRQDSETLAFWRAFSSSPEWMSLPSVRSGRMHLVSSHPWREYSPAAMQLMAESAARLLTGQVPGLKNP